MTNPQLACQSLKSLIELDDREGFWGTVNSPGYGRISDTSQTVGLNFTVDSVYGPTDMDWAIRSTAFLVPGGAPPVGPLATAEAYAAATYTGGYVLWQAMKALGATFNQYPDDSLRYGEIEPWIERLPSSRVAAAWARGAKLRELLKPAVDKQCGCVFP
jgi:hypothetical protein